MIRRKLSIYCRRIDMQALVNNYFSSNYQKTQAAAAAAAAAATATATATAATAARLKK